MARALPRSFLERVLASPCRSLSHRARRQAAMHAPRLGSALRASEIHRGDRAMSTETVSLSRSGFSDHHLLDRIAALAALACERKTSAELVATWPRSKRVHRSTLGGGYGSLFSYSPGAAPLRRCGVQRIDAVGVARRISDAFFDLLASALVLLTMVVAYSVRTSRRIISHLFCQGLGRVAGRMSSSSSRAGLHVRGCARLRFGRLRRARRRWRVARWRRTGCRGRGR